MDWRHQRRRGEARVDAQLLSTGCCPLATSTMPGRDSNSVILREVAGSTLASWLHRHRGFRDSARNDRLDVARPRARVRHMTDDRDDNPPMPRAADLENVR